MKYKELMKHSQTLERKVAALKEENKSFIGQIDELVRIEPIDLEKDSFEWYCPYCADKNIEQGILSVYDEIKCSNCSMVFRITIERKK